jgi:hypothetical protein
MIVVKGPINLGMLTEGPYTGIAGPPGNISHYECRWSLGWPLASNQVPDDQSRIIRRDVDGHKGHRCTNSPNPFRDIYIYIYIYGVRGLWGGLYVSLLVVSWLLGCLKLHVLGVGLEWNPRVCKYRRLWESWNKLSVNFEWTVCR